MTSSGTYNFQPSLGELVLNAFARCGVRRTAIMQEHMTDARFETNLMPASYQSQFSLEMPKPGQIFESGKNMMVACGLGNELLNIITVQPANRAKLAAIDWLNGVRLEKGERLGN